MQQFPSEFEFNEQLLILMLDHSYISQFGTFLHNCVKDREDQQLSTKTSSLWTCVYQSIERYTSPHYVGYEDPEFMETIQKDCKYAFIKPNTNLKCIKLWTNYYLRFDRTVPKGNLLGEPSIWGWRVTHKNQNDCLKMNTVDNKDSQKLLDEIASLKAQLEAEKTKVENLQKQIQEIK